MVGHGRAVATIVEMKQCGIACRLIVFYRRTEAAMVMFVLQSNPDLGSSIVVDDIDTLPTAHCRSVWK